jgi:hypothetical protein
VELASGDLSLIAIVLGLQIFKFHIVALVVFLTALLNVAVSDILPCLRE